MPARDPGLAAHQRWLARVVLDAGASAERDVTDVSLLATAPPGLARERLGAYVGGYPVRIAEAMAEAYPAIRNILGADAFEAMVARYRPQVPRGIYSLGDVGSNLPGMLADDPLTERLPFLADLSTLEWKVLGAFHAFARPPFDMTAAASWSMDDWFRATLEFQAGVAVVESAWPIVDLWETRETVRESIDVEVAGRPQAALVRREGFDVRCDVIERSEAALLRTLAAGATLGDATERLAAGVGAEDAAPDIGGWLGRWAEQGLVVACRSSPR